MDEGSSQKDDLEVKGTFGYVAPEYLMDGECLKYHMAVPYNRHPTDKYRILRSSGIRMHIIRSMTSVIADDLYVLCGADKLQITSSASEPSKIGEFFHVTLNCTERDFM